MGSGDRTYTGWWPGNKINGVIILHTLLLMSVHSVKLLLNIVTS